MHESATAKLRELQRDCSVSKTSRPPLENGSMLAPSKLLQVHRVFAGSSKTSQSETELPLLRHKYPREDTILHSLIYRGMPLTQIFVNEVGIRITRLMPWNTPSNSNLPRLSPRQIRTGSERCSAKECSNDFASLRKLPNQTKIYVKSR